MRRRQRAATPCSFSAWAIFTSCFCDDAKVAAEILGLTLTSRDKDSENPTAMAGFPHHQLDSYLHKLIKAGYRAAVCEQMEDPKQAKGLVKREVTRVVSAGTLTDDGLLDPREANYVAAVCLHHDKRAPKDGSEPRVGIAWAELSSGRFEAGTFARSRIEDELARIGPAEVIYREDDVHFSPDTTAPWSWTPRPAWSFAQDAANETLCKQFSVHNLEGIRIRRGGFTCSSRRRRRADLSSRDTTRRSGSFSRTNGTSSQCGFADRRRNAAQPGDHDGRCGADRAKVRCSA